MTAGQSIYDPATLVERLIRAGDPLSREAVERIQSLEKLCAMMTDSGVILEEDVVELAKADWWWLAEDTEYGADNITAAMQEALEDCVASPLDVVEWCRSHQLENSYAVMFPEIVDQAGRVVHQTRVEEFSSVGEAERAVAEHRLRKRRAEGHGK